MDIFQAVLVGISVVQPEGRKIHSRNMEQSRAWGLQDSGALSESVITGLVFTTFTGC